MGHELDGDVTPVEAGLDGATSRKRAFIGSEALAARRAAGTTKRIVTLIFEDQAAVPLGHEPVYLDGRIIGRTTSAAYGFRIGAPVALAFVDCATAEGRVEVDIARRLTPARMQAAPAFDPSGERMRSRPDR